MMFPLGFNGIAPDGTTTVNVFDPITGQLGAQYVDVARPVDAQGNRTYAYVPGKDATDKKDYPYLGWASATTDGSGNTPLIDFFNSNIVFPAGQFVTATATDNGRRGAAERSNAWEDVAWALINSKEFLLRH